mmetsp:Transcript_19747/g.58557  ORF Transcript_19747/g.58557 Transcript_19747/m.58557 type:complete len:756 (+) Transcript_19747:21-2288(+)
MKEKPATFSTCPGRAAELAALSQAIGPACQKRVPPPQQILSADHLVDKPLRAVVLADEQQDVPHVGADRAGVLRAPLELVHQPEPLAVKVDGDEVAVGVEHGRAAVASDRVGRVAHAARRRRHGRVCGAEVHQPLRAVEVSALALDQVGDRLARAAEPGLKVLVHQPAERGHGRVLHRVRGRVPLHVAGREAEAAVRVRIEGLVGGDALLQLEQLCGQLVALREQRLCRVAVGHVRRVERRRRRNRRVATAHSLRRSAVALAALAALASQQRLDEVSAPGEKLLEVVGRESREGGQRRRAALERHRRRLECSEVVGQQAERQLGGGAARAAQQRSLVRGVQVREPLGETLDEEGQVARAVRRLALAVRLRRLHRRLVHRVPDRQQRGPVVHPAHPVQRLRESCALSQRRVDLGEAAEQRRRLWPRGAESLLLRPPLRLETQLLHHHPLAHRPLVFVGEPLLGRAELERGGAVGGVLRDEPQLRPEVGDQLGHRHLVRVRQPRRRRVPHRRAREPEQTDEVAGRDAARRSAQEALRLVRHVVRRVLGGGAVGSDVRAQQRKVCRVAGPLEIVGVAAEAAEGHRRRVDEPHVPQPLVREEDVRPVGPHLLHLAPHRRLSPRAKEKKRLRKEGASEVVPEDDPATMELQIKVMISRMFAEFEQRKAQLAERDKEMQKRAKQEQAEKEFMEALQKKEQKMWEKSRQKRVNGWRAWAGGSSSKTISKIPNKVKEERRKDGTSGYNEAKDERGESYKKEWR